MQDTWRATSFPYTECEYSLKSSLHNTLTSRYTWNKFFYYVIMATIPKILVQMSKAKFENLYTS